MNWREWIPATLKAIRLQHNLTLADLAKDCGLSISYLSDIETGRTVPPLDTIEKIITPYGLNVILSFSEDDYIPPGYVYVKRETLQQLADIVNEITPNDR